MTTEGGSSKTSLEKLNKIQCLIGVLFNTSKNAHEVGKMLLLYTWAQHTNAPQRQETVFLDVFVKRRSSRRGIKCTRQTLSAVWVCPSLANETITQLPFPWCHMRESWLFTKRSIVNRCRIIASFHLRGAWRDHCFPEPFS